MAIKIRSSKITQRTDTGTDDLTASGFGTIGSGGLEGAAMILTTFSDAAAGVRDGHAVFGVGFTDGTNEYAVCASSRNNNATSVSKKRQTASSNHVMLRNAPNTGDIRSSAAFSAWISDGIRINTDDADNAGKYIQAILFGSDHANAEFEVGNFIAADGNGSTTDPSTMGGEADLVIFASIQRQTMDSNDANMVLSLGIWVNDGDGQGSVNIAELDGSTEGDPFGFLDTNYILATLGASSVLAGFECSAVSTGFRITTRERNSNSTGQKMAYLACRFGHKIKANVGSYQVPTITGTATGPTLAYQLKWLFNLQSHLSADDTWANDDSAETIGFGFYDHENSVEHAMSVGVEHGPASTDTDSLHDDEWHSTHAMAGGGYSVGSPVNVDGTGFDISWTTSNLSSAGRSIYVALTQLNDGPLAATLPSLTADFAGTSASGIDGDLAATLPSLTADFAGIVVRSGPLAATLPALQTDLAGIVVRSGSLTAALPLLTADLAGIVVRSGPLVSSLPALTADLAGTSSAPIFSGPLAADLPALTADLTGIVVRSGPLAADLPALTGSLAGIVVRSGSLAATLPALTADLAGTSGTPVFSGSLAADLPALTADLAGIVVRSGSLAATLPILTTDLAGIVVRSGPLAATFPALTADFAGTSVAPVFQGPLSADLPALTGSLVGIVVRSGSLSTSLPMLSASLAGTSYIPGVLDATLPSLTATIAGIVVRSGDLSATLPALTASFAGTVEIEGVAGVVDATLPSLEASFTGVVVRSGSLTATLPALTTSIAGIVPRKGSLAGTFPSILASFAGTYTPAAVSGSLASTLPMLTASVTGTFTGGVINGLLSATLPSLQGSFTAIGGVLSAPFVRHERWQSQFYYDARSRPRFLAWPTTDDLELLQAGFADPAISRAFDLPVVDSDFSVTSFTTHINSPSQETVLASPSVSVGWRAN